MAADGALEKPVSAQELRAFQALFQFCGWLLYDDLSPEELDRLGRDAAMFSEPPFSQVAPGSSRAFRNALEDGAVEDGFARAVRLDRTYLFYMVACSHVSPYESVYRTDDATMFGPTTLQVRERYAQWGWRFEKLGSEPDDHIGAEFVFMAHLLDRAAGCLERAGGQGASGEGEVAEVLCALRGFLSEHVLVFGPLYLDNLAAQARTDFYHAAARLAFDVLASAERFFEARAVEQIDRDRFSVVGPSVEGPSEM